MSKLKIGYVVYVVVGIIVAGNVNSSVYTIKSPFHGFHYNKKVSLRHKRCTSEPCTFNSTTWCSHVKERFRMQKRHFPCIRPLIEVSDYSGIDKLEGNDANFNRRGKKNTKF